MSRTIDLTGQRFSRLTVLTRVGSEGDYEPGNVRWATRTEQNRNRRNCRDY